jgi:hypothetical protein
MVPMMKRWCIALGLALLAGGCGARSSKGSGPPPLPPTALWPSRPPVLPDTCARKGRLMVVAADDLIGVTADEVAKHFRDTYGLPVEVLSSFPHEQLSAAWDATTRKLRAEPAIAAIAPQLGAPPDAWVMALVHLDLEIAKPTELVVFSSRQGQVTLLSLARMVDSHDGQIDVALLHSRLFKQMARQIGTIYCGLPRKGPESSVMREKILTAADLDAIDEADWRSAP